MCGFAPVACRPHPPRPPPRACPPSGACQRCRPCRRSPGGSCGGSCRCGRRWGWSRARARLARGVSLLGERSGSSRSSGAAWPCGGSGKSAGRGRPPCRGGRPAPQDGPHESPEPLRLRPWPQPPSPAAPSPRRALIRPGAPRRGLRRGRSRTLGRRPPGGPALAHRTPRPRARRGQRLKSNHRSSRTQMAAARRAVMATTTATSQGASGS